MGHFTIRYSRSNALRSLNIDSCEKALNKMVKLLLKKIKKVKKIKKNFSETRDYKKYRLYPGQQIRRRAKKYVPHAAIYIIDGLVLEMGIGPKNCSKKLGNPLLMRHSIAGFTTLKNFKYIAQKEGVDAYKIQTSKDNDRIEIMKRMKRTLDVVGNYKYNFIRNNCLHMANYVTNGNKSYIGIMKGYFHKVNISHRRSRKRR